MRCAPGALPSFAANSFLGVARGHARSCSAISDESPLGGEILLFEARAGTPELTASGTAGSADVRDPGDARMQSRRDNEVRCNGNP